MNRNIAVIFDMDGVLVDNFNYHLMAWEKFCQLHKKSFSADEFRENVFGGNNPDHLKFIFGPQLSQEQIIQYGQEKESIYRELYRNNVQPVTGLKDFLHDLNQAGIAKAIATSAERANVDFILDSVGLHHQFEVVVDSSMISRGKPDPEVFLKAAQLIQVNPSDCIVLEDSLKGIEAALRARMKVIGVGTTHHVAELTEAHYVINDFSELTFQKISEILN